MTAPAAVFGATSRPPKTARPWPVPRVPGPERSEILARWDAGRSTPWIDPVGERDVLDDPGVPRPVSGESPRDLRFTFVVEVRDAEKVLFWANRLADETDLSTTLMTRVVDTDLWVASFVMPADWRASYCFLVGAPGESAPWTGDGDQIRIRAALDAGHADPRNPDSCRNRAGVEQSVVQGPDAPQAWDVEVSSGPLPADWRRTSVDVGGRVVDVVEPVDAHVDLPLLLVLDGEVWDVHHGVGTAVARWVGSGRIRATRVVLVSSGGRDERWRELAGDTDAHLSWLAEVVTTLAPGAGPEAVTLVGQSLGGVTALRGVLGRPDVFGWALSQSASTWLPGLSSTPPVAPVRGGVHLAHGAQEWVLSPGHVELAGVLARHGVPSTQSVHQGGHDYAWWRHGLVEALVWQEMQRRASVITPGV